MSKAVVALAAVTGIIAGAALHVYGCASITREDQRNICRNSRHIVRVAKRKIGM